MDKIEAKVLVALFLLAASLGCHGQVYAIGMSGGAYTILRVDEHTWTVGPWNNCYGVVQFRSRTGEQAPWFRYTTIHFGARYFTVRMPALIVAGIGIAGLGSLVWMGYAFIAGARNRQREEIHAG